MHDTYFVVAHFHYVLFGGSVMTVFAGVYFWYPKVFGRMINERLGKLHFWSTFVFSNATFFPMHWLGLEGMPRRVADYDPAFEGWNTFISLVGVLPRRRHAVLRLQRDPLRPARRDRRRQPVGRA